ncbi:MAG: DUF2061 domain-containing protein [Pikeienuella sp.]
METTLRTTFKAVTWQTTGLLGTSGIGYYLTGSLTTAGSFAVTSAALGFVMYFVHEKLWSKIGWGRKRETT